MDKLSQLENEIVDAIIEIIFICFNGNGEGELQGSQLEQVITYLNLGLPLRNAVRERPLPRIVTLSIVLYVILLLATRIAQRMVIC